MFPLRWALHRVRKISRSERRLLAEAAALLPCVHAMQQLMPFKRWRRLLERSETPVFAAVAPGNRPSIDQIVWSVRIAGRYVPGEYKCLPNAYTAHLLLHRYGYPSQIQVGVARDTQGKVEAHAWVECEGRTVVGELDDMHRFVAFPPLPSLTRLGK